MSVDHFLIAGAQRSGTTLLYHLLDQHPEIEMARPLRPEPRFFLREACGSEVAGYDREFFRGKPGARLKGEKSTTYLERGDVAGRVLTVLGDVKSIFVLRDPVERAISNYRFSSENGVETVPIEHALRREEERRETYDRNGLSASPFAYLARGHYCQFLEPWEAALGRHRMFVMLFEELIRNPAVVGQLFRWLGVDPAFAPVVPPRPVNPSKVHADVGPELRRHLIEHFRQSNRLLAQRYGFDLSLWQS